MNLHLREALPSDLPFLREMLYEAVFWRASLTKPSFEEGLAYPEVSKELADWGARERDTAVIATMDSLPVGAAWFRCWTDDDSMRGYVDQRTPVLAIGVHRDYRRQGIGGTMIDWLVDAARRQSIPIISLCVSKDNYALALYRQKGFREYADIGDSLIMVRRV